MQVHDLTEFTAPYSELTRTACTASIMLWLLVFGCKFTESYYFLTSSFSSPIAVMAQTTLFGTTLLDLFFLNIYFWYIIWAVVFSVGRAFLVSLLIWMPQKDVYTCLPKHIYAKLLDTAEIEVKGSCFIGLECHQHHKHLLGIDHTESPDGRRTLNPPLFFLNQNGKDMFFPTNGEAERRILFFTSSFITTLPEPLPIQLSLHVIIREEDQNTCVTLLEYLKQFHSVEWDNLVKDTKIFAGENENGTSSINENPTSNKADDSPFYCIGFKTSSLEYTLRTCIWTSPHADPRFEQELERMARRKFKFAISMQWFSKFNKEEQENTEFLLRTYPNLQILYLDEEPGLKGSVGLWFSTWIDGHPEIDNVTGKWKHKFHIELPRDPILVDGKSDNQNHTIIFYRGECLLQSHSCL
ncbi:beta-1,3-glucan synthase catalytic subunit 1 [Suillus subluteus]|nr:beta-1,3-glucan synthase catalytic subunit 1 [Suillus subluteus]